MNYIYFGVIGICTLVSLFYILKCKNKFVKLLLTFGSGLVTMLVINLLSKYTGVSIPLNYYTLGVCSTMGVSGNLMLVVINSLLI